MLDKKYSYTICTAANKEIFYKQCKALEKNISGIKKDELLQDVDDTLIQKYFLNGKEIVVYNDIDADAVYVESDVELTQYFK